MWNSADGGASWTSSPATLGQRVTGIRRLPQFASARQAAVAAIVGSSPEIFVSADGGVTFAQAGGSQGAWGQTSSSTAGLTVSNDGQYAANKTLYVRCDTCSDTDLWRIKPNEATPGAFAVERVGVPASLRPLGHHTLVDTPGVAGGTALICCATTPASPIRALAATACGDASAATLCTASAMQWRTFSPAAMTPGPGAAWRRRVPRWSFRGKTRECACPAP